MSEQVYNVLFLCTGNSARSIMGECLVNQLGKGKFRGFSAGSKPKGAVHPQTLALLKSLNIPFTSLRSKSWDEFARPAAPKMDFVFTVCERAAAESCPVWPGQPITGDWSIPDPADVEGSDAERAIAFADAFRMLRNRVSLFMALPFETLDKLSLKRRIREIGRE
jgi:arsenate reductase (thioredoxin)